MKMNRPVQQSAKQTEIKVENIPFPSIGNKAYYGLYLQDDDTVSKVNDNLGAGKLNIFAVFENFSTNKLNNTNKLNQVCKLGKIPLVSWQSWSGSADESPYSLDDIAAGKYDNIINNFFDNIESVCPQANVIIRFDHEMEMRPQWGSPWTPWQGQPEAYVAAWKHIVTIQRDRNLMNIKWLWSPDRADQYIMPYYPGDDYVDYVGLTLNEQSTDKFAYPTFREFYAPNQEWIESLNKPVLIGETAYYSPNGDDIAAWINGTFEYVASNPKIVGIVWFNQKLSNVDYSISVTSEGKQAFYNNLSQY